MIAGRYKYLACRKQPSPCVTIALASRDIKESKDVSPLTSGYWEVIIRGKQSLQLACTADQNGVDLGLCKGV